MKKVMIKYTIEIPEDKLDKFCKISQMGRHEATSRFKDLAEVYGRTAVFELIEDTFIEYKENQRWVK